MKINNRLVAFIALLFGLMICLIMFLNPAFAANKLYVEYGQPGDENEKQIKEKLLKSGAVSEVTSLINDKLELQYSLRVVFGGEDGPLYDGETKEILIPYLFLDEVKERFKKANYADTGVSAEDATMDALMHTLFHELGHALIPMFDFPVLGKEEDAADSLATTMLIEYFEDGEEIALSAADLFDLESNDVEEFTEEDFWDEHGLDAQRFYATLCMVYGSNEDKYAYLAKEVGFSDDRAALCVEEYENISNSWLTLLDKHQKKLSNR